MSKRVQSPKLKAQIFGNNLRVPILICLIIISMIGCGKKAPPVPWELIVPKRIVDLEATSREGRILLEWSSPKENTDRSPLVDLAKFQILRSEGILREGRCIGCGEKMNIFHELILDVKDEVKGKRFSIFIEDHEAGKVYVYQVVPVNSRGHSGSPSNPVWVYWEDPPNPPGKLKGEGGDKRVDLSWDSVEGVTGYNIYRREEGEGFSLRPLNREPLIMPRYTDLNVENERRYIYSIRAVKRVGKTDIEGKGSLEIHIIPTDLTPPIAPVGLIAIPLKNGIELSWQRNQEPDLLGYHVYRRGSGEEGLRRLTESPLKKELYLDTGVKLGQDYFYSVTAVDGSPRMNESPFSEEVHVKYLY